MKQVYIREEFVIKVKLIAATTNKKVQEVLDEILTSHFLKTGDKK